ncbi:MAG: AAA family ATPase, partial [Desulfovibrionaceae bacterium]|nr:AAA family ATPase [Desulfovibrionaceae bacterium]
FKDMEVKSFKLALSNFLDLINSLIFKHHKLFFQNKNIPNFLVAKIKKITEIEEHKAYLFEEILRNSWNIIIQIFYQIFNKEVILLIDEYDVPINAGVKYNYYGDIVDFIRNLFSKVLKSNEYLKLAILTGCLRISKESIFTGVNHLACYSISEIEYADKFGFSPKEVKNLLMDAGINSKDKMIKEWYDGYILGQNTEIYCPWDVLYYIADLQNYSSAHPKAYWMNTSANNILNKSFELQNSTIVPLLQTIINGNAVAAKIDQNITFENLQTPNSNNILNLLYFTGYLTKTKSNNYVNKDLNEVSLIIPNKEISVIFKNTLIETVKNQVQNQFLTLPSPQIEALAYAFLAGKEKCVTNLISKFLSKIISFFDYDYNFYHGFLLGLLSAKFPNIKSNRESGLGRFDIEIAPNNHPIGIIIEIKSTQDKNKLHQLSIEALNQIEDQQYDQELRAKYKKIIHWGIVFYKKQCLAKANSIEV